MLYLLKRWANNGVSAVARVAKTGTLQAFRLPLFRSVRSRAWGGEYVDAVASNGDVRNSFSHPTDRVLCEGPELAINDLSDLRIQPIASRRLIFACEYTELESAEFLRLSHGLILAFVSADPVLGNPIRLA